MTKYSNVFQKQEIVSYVPKHVYEIVRYLKTKGYKIECFEEIDKSKYILSFNDSLLRFRSCKEICKTLESTYYKEQEKEVQEYYKKKCRKEEKINDLIRICNKSNLLN